MAIRDIYLQAIYNVHRNEDVDYIIEEVHAGLWYVGIRDINSGTKADAVWNIYRMASTANIINIASQSGIKNQIWDDRATIFPVLPYIPQYSILLDGVDEYATITDLPPNFDTAPENAFTVCCWVKFIGPSGAHPIISSLTNLDTKGWELNFDGVGKKPYFIARNASSTNTLLINGNTGVNYNEWNHIIFTKSAGKAASNCTMYLNGVLQTINVVTDNWTSSIASSSELRIGSRKNEGTYSYDGQIKDLIVYDKEFNQTEATELYNLGKSTDALLLTTKDDIVIYYKLGDGVDDSTIAGETLFDEVGGSIATCANTENIDIVNDIP